MPLDRAELIDAANRASKAGLLDDAAALCRQLLATDPTDIQAKTLSGVIAARRGQYDEAINQLDDVLRANPNSVEALIWLSISFRKMGSLKPAAGAALRAAQLKPGDPHVLNNLGMCQMALMQLDEATKSFQAAAEKQPSSEVFQNLGTVLYMQGLQGQASFAFKKAVELAPQSADALVGLGRALMSQEQFEEALRCVQKAVALNPEMVGARILMAQLLIQSSHANAALEHIERAAQLDPNHPDVHGVYGTALQSEGRIEEANAHFRKSIEIRPNQGYPYFAIVHNRKVTEADRQFLNEMERLTENARLPQSEIQYLHYGLGRAYENLKEYERSIKHYDEANRIAHYIKFRGEAFDRQRHAAPAEWAKGFFTPELFEKGRGMGSDSDKPILIVGMMRSGTTLMEQILSSHPEVEGAGELTFWTEKGPSAFDSETRLPIQECVRTLAHDYLGLLSRLAPGAKHVTDKMPANTLAAGVIHMTFPNARIIYMVRNSSDNCFSIYATPNEARFDFGHKKESIAFAYQTQMGLLEHWKAVLPPDRLLPVSYEELVEDRERVTREVVAFCGLEWSDLCLSPEKNERSVATPSVWQVRQPVYKTSMQRWKNFAPWIAEFVDLVE